MKKFFSSFALLLVTFCLFAAAACGGDDKDKDKDQSGQGSVVTVTGISLDKTETTLKIGETVKLTASVSPDNATDKTVTWNSSDAAVATVKDGTVTAVHSGKATVTASSGGKSATCTVNVLRPSDTISIGEKKFETLGAAVGASKDGDVIDISNGKYTVSESVRLDKRVTLRGEAGYTVIETASSDNVLTIAAEGVTVEGVTFTKTNKDGASFSFLHAEKNGLTVKNCTFTGKYEDGDNEVTRAMVFNAGVSGYTIEGNTVKNLRQPAYLEGNGTVKNNTVENTRGFVVCCNFKVTFEGNSFKNNAADIAVIENGGAENVYTEQDGVKLSADNNGAYVDLQPLGIKIKDGKKVTA